MNVAADTATLFPASLVLMRDPGNEVADTVALNKIGSNKGILVMRD